MSRNKLRVSLKECREIHSKVSFGASRKDIKAIDISQELFHKIDNHLNDTHYAHWSALEANTVYFFKRSRLAPWEEDIFGH